MIQDRVGYDQIFVTWDQELDDVEDALSLYDNVGVSGSELEQQDEAVVDVPVVIDNTLADIQDDQFSSDSNNNQQQEPRRSGYLKSDVWSQVVQKPEWETITDHLKTTIKDGYLNASDSGVVSALLQLISGNKI